MNLIAVPVYNEEAFVAPVLSRVREVASDRILVVDDGSTDGSVSEAASVEGVEILRHAQNEGYGRSLIDAFHYALAGGYESVITLDCDEQHDPSLIPLFLELVEDWDIVSGTRYSPASRACGDVPLERQRINERITRLVNDLTGYTLTDAFCGYKAYRTTGLAKLSLSEAGYAMPLQLWLQASRAGLTVTETPVPRIYHDADRTFGRDLDSPEQRLEYYLQVVEVEMARQV